MANNNLDLDCLTKHMEKKISDIKQRSPEWLDARAFGIGGSSMACITGGNPYQSLKQFMLERAGIDRRNINPLYVGWGNLFEQAVKRYAEAIFSTEILYSDSYAQYSKNIHYSPDGVGVIVGSDGVARRALFEFKAPFSRIPNGEIPTSYVPQLKLGLDVIECEYAAYVECVFRKCRYDALYNGKVYDESLGQRSCGRKPVAIGLIGLYIDESNTSAAAEFRRACIEEFDTDPIDGGDLIDFGECSRSIFLRILQLFESGIITIRHSDTIFKTDIPSDDAELIGAELGQLGDCFGIIPWKMLRADVHKLSRHIGYLKSWASRIDAVCDKLREVAPLSDKEKTERICAFIDGH
jgi:hypothetical protein